MRSKNPLFPACDFRDFGRALHAVNNPKGVAPVKTATIQDDRTPKQQKTHCRAVLARDPGMSFWGASAGGTSLCVWACAPGVDVSRVLSWVDGRSDMENAEVIDLDEWEAPEGTANVHIYVCNAGHPGTL